MQQVVRSAIAGATAAAARERGTHAAATSAGRRGRAGSSVRRFSAAAAPPPPPSANSSVNPHAKPPTPATPQQHRLQRPMDDSDSSAAAGSSKSNKGGWAATVVPAGSFMDESQIEHALRAQIARVRAAAAILEREAREAEAAGLPRPKSSLPPRAPDPKGTPYPSPPQIPRSLLEQLSPAARALYDRESKEAEEARVALQNDWHEQASWRNGGWKTARFWGPRRRRALLWFNFGWGGCILSLLILWRQEWGPDAGMYQLRREDEMREQAILEGRDPRLLGLPERDAHGHIISSSSAAVRWSKSEDPPRGPRTLSPSAMAFAPKVAKAMQQGAAMMSDPAPDPTNNGTTNANGRYIVKPKPQQQ